MQLSQTESFPSTIYRKVLMGNIEKLMDGFQVTKKPGSESRPGLCRIVH
jgi:GH24 family phage-related lysozyme (muramidase)